MIKPPLLALLCVLAMVIPSMAQSVSDTVVWRFAEFKKSKVAVDACVMEEGRMQVERNAHYDALLRANAKNPDAPTIDEMSDAKSQVVLEDEALSEKRDECSPLFDQLVAATRQLRRDCGVYMALAATDEPAEEMNTFATDICRSSPRTAAQENPR